MQSNTVTPDMLLLWVTALKFLSKETSGIFVTQITSVPKLHLPVFTTICSVTGVVCYS